MGEKAICGSDSFNRQDIPPHKHRRTIAGDSNPNFFNGFEFPSLNDKNWKLVDVLHLGKACD
ncbi:MAG: hypothetical protein Q8907_15405 [Bacteroidota bacterium]|nr:hypothetical protein [Bacteroidota bacterium]